MGNFSKGVSSDSENSAARCPGRKSLAEVLSLKASPALSSGVRSFGIANAPKAITGVSLSSSRRLIRLNLLSSIEISPNGIHPSRDADGIRRIWQSYTIWIGILPGFNLFHQYAFWSNGGFFDGCPRCLKNASNELTGRQLGTVTAAKSETVVVMDRRMLWHR